MKKLQKHGAPAIGIGIGLLASLVTGTMLSAILAWIIIKGHGEEKTYLIFAIQMLSSGAGAWTAVLLAGEKKLITCAAETVTYLLLLAGITLAAFHGHFGSVMQGSIAVASGAILPIFLCRKGKKGGKRISKSRVYR